MRSRLGDSVKGLLGRARNPVLSQISAQKGSQDAWRAWLATRLPEDLAGRVSGVVEREGVLTVFTESAAWSARLRFALAEADADVRARSPGLSRVVVKVMPR
ncbi:MAG: DciA family protein [Gammaproteobacteria bacterium]